jgi:trimethylamine--corrinoid protein Co-methyltransferase
MHEESSGFRLLTDDQVGKIYSAALDVLSQTGVKFADGDILDSLARQGARVDREQGRAHFPRSLVEEAIGKVKPAFSLYSRDPKRHLRIGRPEVHFCNSTYDVWVLDYRTGRREASTLAHVEKFVRLNDALENIDIIGAQVVPQDVPLPLQQIKVAETLLKNTTKPFVMNFLNGEEFDTVFEMVAAVAGGEDRLRERPIMVTLLCPDSPLRYEAPVTDVIRRAVRRGIPVGIGPCPILGASSPITLAGALTQALAEALAGVVFVKSVNEDCPVYLGTTPFVMAPQGNLLMAAPESYLISMAYAQMCIRLGIPNSFSCTHSDSKIPTLQTGYEKAMGLMMAVFSGSPLIQVPAILDDGATTSLEQLVIEAEMAGAARRILRRFAVSDETLALDVIAECALSGGFPAHDHTVAHLRSEFWSPSILFRGTREQAEDGKKTLVENAVRKVEDILANHRPAPLPAEIEAKIKAIVSRVRS